MKQIALIVFSSLLIFSSCGSRDIFYYAEAIPVALVPLNSAARYGSLSLDGRKQRADYAYFRFTGHTKNTALACMVQAIGRNTDGATLYFAYLYDDDFDTSGRLLQSLQNREMAAVTEFSGSVSLALENDAAKSNSNSPCGFLVALASSENTPVCRNKRAVVRILSFHSMDAKYGWQINPSKVHKETDRTHTSNESTENNELHCGFSGAGGIFNATTCTYKDFGALLNVSPKNWQICATVSPDTVTLQTTNDTETPQLPIVEWTANASEKATYSFSCIVPPQPYTAVFPGIIFDATPSSITCTKGRGNITSFYLERKNQPYAGASNASGDIEPITIDPGLIPYIRKSLWRRSDIELYAWDRFPNVLIFDTATYKVQSALFKRLAFFVEKAGYRGKLLTDKEMENMHGYNAHDYRAENLAEFFTAAHKSHFELNRYEMMLRDILLTSDIIRITKNDDGNVVFTAGVGAVISISKDSTLFLRTQFLTHEGLHGIYFTDADFRQKVHQVYTSMPPYAITFIETYFTAMDSLQYDVNDRYLMENEFMAYIMQQTKTQIPDYFVGKYSRRLKVRNLIPEITTLVDKSNGTVFVQAGTELGSYVANRWGMDCGRVHLLQLERNTSK